MTAERRRDGREVRQHGKRGKRKRGWHKGRGQAVRWLQAVGRLDREEEEADG
jgi:hypothetical protein